MIAFKPLKAVNMADKALDAEKKLERSLDKVCCFVAGTLVLTEFGERPIEEIKLGDLVYAKNPDTGEQALKPVTHLFEKQRYIFALEVVSSSGEEKLIETTDDHPFFVIGKGWVNAANLIPGDEIESDKKGPVKVVSAQLTERIATTYNIEVADFHTYYATELGLLVHNVECNLDNAPRGGTYALTDESGDVMRTGRTNDLARRESEHGRDPQTRNLRFEEQHRTDNRSEQRGLEQMLHDEYKPPLNKINPISPNNARLGEYMDAARKFLGM